MLIVSARLLAPAPLSLVYWLAPPGGLCRGMRFAPRCWRHANRWRWEHSMTFRGTGPAWRGLHRGEPRAKLSLRALTIVVATATAFVVAPSAVAMSTVADAVPASFAPGVQNAAPSALFTAVSCGAPGDCTAAGDFQDTSGNTQAFTETSTGGVWAAAVPATFAAGVQSAAPNAIFSAVSCSAPGDCTAAGAFQDAAGGREAFTETSNGGVWADAVPASFAGGVQSTVANAEFGAVSCASPGGCTAAGAFTDAAGFREAFTETSAGGAWAIAAPASFAAGVQSTPPSAQLFSVSCSTPGNCTASGIFRSPSATQAFTQTSTDGVWADAVQASYPAGARSPDPQGELFGVSCISPGDCTAAGRYTNTAGNPEPFAETSTGGVWGTGVAASFAAGVENAAGNAYYDSVSCASPGDCSAAGQFVDASGDVEAFTTTSTSGTWAAASPAVFAAGIQGGVLAAGFNAISCASPGNCTAAGVFVDAASNLEAFTETSAGGVWATSVPATFAPGRQNASPNDEFGAVSCAAPGDCTAAGQFSDAGAHTEAVTETTTATPAPNAITATSAAPGRAVIGATGYRASATALSGDSVTITVDPPSTAVCTITSGEVIYLAVGICVLDFNDPGNRSYAPAPQLQQSFLVASPVPSGAPTAPDSPARPSDRFSVDSYKHASDGTIELTLDLPGAGSVTTLGTHSDPPGADAASSASTFPVPGYRRFAWAARHTTSATAAGILRVTLHPDASGARMLHYVRGHGWALHIRVWATYTPTGGRPASITITIRVHAARNRLRR
jgi:hypothetical protein